MSASVELPPHVVVLRDFANTLDEESGGDALPTPADLARWLQHYDLLPDHEGADATATELERARSLRDGLRRAMSLHHDNTSAPLPHLDALARELPLRVDFATDQPRLSPVSTGVDAGLAQLLVAVMAAHSDHTWPRLKLCHASDCRWAFYDVSKNRSRTWCAMGVCGNRAKTRSYRARRRAADSAPAETT